MGKLYNKMKYKLSIFTIILLLISVFILTALSTTTIKTEIGDLIEEGIGDDVKSLTAYLDSWMIGQIGNLEGIADVLSATTNIEDEDTIDILKMYFDKYEGNEYYGAYKDGTYLDASGWIPPSDYNPLKRDWYLDTINKKEVQISSPYVDADHGDVVITISKIVKDSKGETKGVMSSDIRLNHFLKALNEYEVGRDAYVILVDSEENILVHNNEAYLPTSDKSIPIDSIGISTILNTDNIEKIKYEKDYDGIERAFISQNMDTTGWRVILAKPKSSITNITVPLVQKILIASIIILIGASIASQMVGSLFTKPINESLNVLRNIGDLDFTDEKVDLKKKYKLGYTEEVGAINHSIYELKDSLKGIILSLSNISSSTLSQSESLKELAFNLTNSMNEVGKATDDIAHGATSQTSFLGEGVQELNDLANKIIELNHTVMNNNKVTQNISNDSKHGKEAINNLQMDMNNVYQSFGELAKTINDLSKKTSTITNITSTIEEIASQTNLLALNANIEAAKAGEAGKSFSVVANEIRKLSDETTEATSKIETIITDIVRIIPEIQKQVGLNSDSTNIAVSTTEKTVERFEKIEKEINNLSLSMVSLLDISEEVLKSKDISLSAAEKSLAIIENSAAATEELSASITSQLDFIDNIKENSRTLLEDVSSLDGIIQKFKL